MNTNKSIEQKSNSGSGCLTLFGSVFLCAGLIIGFFALKTLFSSLNASSWDSVQATILSSKLEVNTGSDATTYRATGQFSYRYEGTIYTSENLFFGRGGDNIGSFHHDLVRDMEKAQNQKQSMQAWVNPRKPSQAVLSRDIRWGMFGFMMIFPLVFGGAGAGIMYWARHVKKLHAKEIELQQLYPQQPWMWREEWHSNSIKSSNKTLLWFSIFFASFWCLVSSPVLFIIPTEILDKKNYLALIALLFPIIGIGLAAWAIRNYFQWKKFGSSELLLKSMPAYLGRTLSADLHIPAELSQQDECTVIFECVHKYTSGSGKNRSTRETIEWQDQQRIPVNPANFDGHTLPITFKVPNNLPVTDWSNASNEYFWRLRAEAQLPGVDYTADFIIPVFERDQSNLSEDERYEDEFFADLEHENTSLDNGDWQHLNLQHQQTVEGSKYIFARARQKGTAFMLTLMALLFGGVGVAMFVVKNGSIFLGVMFAIFGFFLSWGALHQWLYKSEFTASYNKLSLRSGWFMTNASEYRNSDVKQLYKHSSMSSGNVKYYGIYIDTHHKKKIKLAENLVGNRDIDSLIAKISDELGLNNT